MASRERALATLERRQLKVLVTGHGGYLGSVLVPLLEAAGHGVTGLDSGLFRRCAFPGAGAPPAPPQLAMDLRDVTAPMLAGFDAVIHLAGLSNDPLGELDPAVTDAINHRATATLAAAAKAAGVRRFLYASSCSIYGASTGDLLDEHAEPIPVTPYGRSKIAAERALLAIADRRFRVTCLRGSTVYGLSPFLRFDLVLNNLVAWVAATGQIHFKSDGIAWRPLLHVEDFAQAFLRVLEAADERVGGEIFNVAVTEHNMRVRTLAELIVAAAPWAKLHFAADAGGDLRNYRVSGEKLRHALPEWQPRRSPASTIPEMLRAFTDAGVAIEDFEGPRYQRLAHLRQLQGEGLLGADLRWSASAARRDAAPVSAILSDPAPMKQACRFCGRDDLRLVLDLGWQPASDGFVAAAALLREEPRAPLRLGLCANCGLLQLLDCLPPETLFGADYLYFSSVSAALQRHAADLADQLLAELPLQPGALVMEIASNDGYLLRHFRERGITVLGIDPAPRQAAAARALGITTLESFFNLNLARLLRAEGRRPAIIVANNVLAHTPAPNDFVAGLALLCGPDTMISIEVPYVRDLIEQGAFDTIYHEHVSYFSVTMLDRLFAAQGLMLTDVERIAVNGGSLRLRVGRSPARSERLEALLREERAIGLTDFAYYAAFAGRVTRFRDEARRLLQDLKTQGKRIAAYGAAAKGTILLNYLGLDTRCVDFVVDRNTHKQGRFVPGVRIPIVGPDALESAPPDYLLLLPWNLRSEILAQETRFRQRGGRFIVPIPQLEVV